MDKSRRVQRLCLDIKTYMSFRFKFISFEFIYRAYSGRDDKNVKCYICM